MTGLNTPMPSRRPSGGLPAEPTSFVGREAELAYLADVLRTGSVRDADGKPERARVVTVTGPGGVGKTRLALRAARLVADHFADGVCLVRLSQLGAPDLLPNTAAAVLGLVLTDRDAMDAVLAYLRDRRMLLILDTCEHLIGTAAEFARKVTAESDGVTVLATSRQPLGLDSEHRFPLEPLPVPEEDGDLAGGDAADLFVQRARTVAPGFTLDDETRADVITICHRLAGIPLALELAAVRLRALSLRELVAGFSMEMTTGSRRTGVRRHRDLRSALGWSYDLCTEAEKAVWCRLSVFAGSFTFGAVTAVCGGSGLDCDEIAEAMDGLVRKSVLIQVGDADEDRYRLLDPIREFGADELNAAGDGASVRGRHIAYYLGLARDFHAHSVSDSQLRRYAELLREHPNLQAAMEYAFVLDGNERAAVDISTSLFLFWHMAGLAWEGEYWLNRAIGRCAAASPLRPRILAVRAFLRCILGEFDLGREDAIAAIRGAERLGDTVNVARAHCALHRALTWSDDLASASTIADTASRLLEEEGKGGELGLAQLAQQVVFAELRARDLPAATRAATDGLKRLPPGEFWARGYLLFQLGLCQFVSGDEETGTASVRRALQLKHELGDVTGVGYCVGALGLLAADQERYERAAWLFGAAEARWELVGRRFTGNPFMESWHQRATAAARGALGPEKYSRLWNQGMAAGPSAIALVAARDSDSPARDFQ